MSFINIKMKINTIYKNMLKGASRIHQHQIQRSVRFHLRRYETHVFYKNGQA